MIELNLQVGDYIDLLYTKRAERLAKAEEVEAMEKEEKAIREHIISLLGEASLEGAKGNAATASITRRVVGSVTDWSELYAYILKTGSFDLLHKRVSDTAYRDRLEQKEVVPGVEPVTVVGLSLVKASRKD